MEVKTSSAMTGIVEGVAFKYAEKTYEKVRDLVAGRVERDVMSEFSFMASLFKRFVIGKAYSQPRGTLVPTHEWSTVSRSLGMRSEPLGLSWAPRTAKYLTWKEKHFHHKLWYKNNNQVIPGALGTGENWVNYFGPIRVGIQRTGGSSQHSLGTLSNRMPYQAGSITRYKSLEDTSYHMKFAVARVSVSALTYITPGQLPALANGNVHAFGVDGRRSGLLGHLPPEVAYRLGSRGAKYRHTIEPFLGFFLTRAVPNALFLRIEQGLGAKLDIRKRKN